VSQNKTLLLYGNEGGVLQNFVKLLFSYYI